MKLFFKSLKKCAYILQHSISEIYPKKIIRHIDKDKCTRKVIVLLFVIEKLETIGNRYINGGTVTS